MLHTACVGDELHTICVSDESHAISVSDELHTDCVGLTSCTPPCVTDKLHTDCVADKSHALGGCRCSVSAGADARLEQTIVTLAQTLGWH